MRTNSQIARIILADVYSCLKIHYKMNIDNLDSNIMLKVLEKHFNLHEFDSEGINKMLFIQESVCKVIHSNPLKFFNFTYKKAVK